MTSPTETVVCADDPITPLDRPPLPAAPLTRLVPPVGVIQPLPGIGDMVWHLPHIRAIAAHAGMPVTVLTKPRSLADQLLAHEPSVADVAWLDLNPAGRRGLHDGVFGFRRLVRDLRARRFGSIILLHHSDLLAAAAWMAGIPDRRGYGWGRQRWFLNTGPFLPPDVKRLHQHARATRYLAASAIDLPSPEPSIDVPASIRAAARQRFGAAGYVAIGVGSSEALKQWGPKRFSALAAALLDAGWPRLLLLGGAEEQALVNRIITDLGRKRRAGAGWDWAGTWPTSSPRCPAPTSISATIPG